MLLKQCRKCKNKYPATNQYFRICNETKCGLRTICKKCARKEDKQYRIEHPDAQQKWWANNQNKYKIYYQKECQIPKNKYSTYKRSAIKRRINWDLTFEQFKTFWQKSCYYCGDKIETIGLDRIDNSKGYNLDNIVSCCKMCNKMKLNYSEKDFINHCKKITDFLKRWKSAKISE